MRHPIGEFMVQGTLWSMVGLLSVLYSPVLVPWMAWVFVATWLEYGG